MRGGDGEWVYQIVKLAKFSQIFSAPNYKKSKPVMLKSGILRCVETHE